MLMKAEINHPILHSLQFSPAPNIYFTSLEFWSFLCDVTITCIFKMWNIKQDKLVCENFIKHLNLVQFVCLLILIG